MTSDATASQRVARIKGSWTKGSSCSKSGKRRSASSAASGQSAAVLPAVSEETIHRAVVDALERCARPGVVWLHPANGGARGKAEAGRFRALGVVAGMPDLFLFAGGQTFALELKAEGGRLSPAQRAQLARLEVAGVRTAVAEGIDPAMATLAGWGLLRVSSSLGTPAFVSRASA